MIINSLLIIQMKTSCKPLLAMEEIARKTRPQWQYRTSLTNDFEQSNLVPESTWNSKFSLFHVKTI